MNIQYHCTNKIYIGKSTQIHNQALSSKCGSGNSYGGNLRMKGWIDWRGAEAAGLLMSIGRR